MLDYNPGEVFNLGRKPKTMKKLLLFVLFAAGAAAQQRQPVSSMQPDCMVTFNFTAASSGAQASGTVTAGSTGTTAVIDNRTDAGCLDWLVTYSTTTGISALSLLFQTATNVNGVPGTWSAYGGTLTSGINPNTAATPPWAITDATGTKYPFLRMNLTALTGAGTVSGNLYGWKRRPSYTTAVIAPGTICTAAAPCPVDGPTAAGSPPTFAPVMVAGQDGAPGNIRTIHTDTVGNQRVVGAAADGAAVVGDPVRIGGKDGGGNTEDILTNTAGNIDPAGVATALADGATNTPNRPSASGAAVVMATYPSNFNGSTWDRQIHCNTLATANLSGSGQTQIIAASGTTVIHICSVNFSTTATEDVKITQGTGSNCATPGTPADLTGLYKSVQSFDFEYPAGTTLNGSASQALCISQSAVQAAGVTILYAQF